ncbi:uncharacterized mitochondrial protein AtMg00810-like [Nicotiana tomentosiformis]|uniref:uncharacterized mitochondrial protein AtMg00810-like n=1 Tax=Nicotiana tomentosiformis TaxID=4098 RepID=UPI00087805E8
MGHLDRPDLKTYSRRNRAEEAIMQSTEAKPCLAVYVDDIVMIGDDKEEMARLKKLLAHEFEIKDVGKLQYLLGIESTPGKGLLFSKHDHLQKEAFTDADWAGSLDDRRSTSSYCMIVGGNLITWRRKKQRVVSRSSAKAEYKAMA